MTAVQSLSFAQHKSEQNKIAIAKAGYHYSSGILPFVLYGALGGQSLCTQEKGQALTYRGVLSLAGVIYFAQFKQIGIYI